MAESISNFKISLTFHISILAIFETLIGGNFGILVNNFNYLAIKYL